MLKEIVKVESTREEKDHTKKKNPQELKKMAIRTYISIITLNVNGLNAPTKRHRLAEWIQKKTYVCLHIWVYKKPTSDLKTHID